MISDEREIASSQLYYFFYYFYFVDFYSWIIIHRSFLSPASLRPSIAPRELINPVHALIYYADG